MYRGICTGADTTGKASLLQLERIHLGVNGCTGVAAIPQGGSRPPLGMDGVCKTASHLHCTKGSHTLQGVQVGRILLPTPTSQKKESDGDSDALGFSLSLSASPSRARSLPHVCASALTTHTAATKRAWAPRNKAWLFPGARLAHVWARVCWRPSPAAGRVC